MTDNRSHTEILTVPKRSVRSLQGPQGYLPSRERFSPRDGVKRRRSSAAISTLLGNAVSTTSLVIVLCRISQAAFPSH